MFRNLFSHNESEERDRRYNEARISQFDSCPNSSGDLEVAYTPLAFIEACAKASKQSDSETSIVRSPKTTLQSQDA